MNAAPLIPVTPTLAPPPRKQKKKRPVADKAPWPPGSDSSKSGTGTARVNHQNKQDVSQKTCGSKDTSTTTTAMTEPSSWGGDSFDSLQWEDIQVMSRPTPNKSGLSAASKSQRRERDARRDDSTASNISAKMLQEMMQMSTVKDDRAEQPWQDMATEWPPAANGNVATKESKPRKKSSSKHKKDSKTSDKKSSKKISSEARSVSPSKKADKAFTTPFSPTKSPARSAKRPQQQSSQHRVEFALPPLPLPLDARSDDGMSQLTAKNTNSSSSKRNRKLGLTKSTTAATSMPIIPSNDTSTTSFTQMTPRTRRSKMLGKHPSMSLAADGHGPSLHSVFCWGGDKPAKHNDLPSGAFVVTSLVTKRESMAKSKPAPLQQVQPTPTWPSKRLSNRSLHAQFYERTMGQTPQVASEASSSPGITAAQMLDIMEPCSVREVLAFNGFQGGFDDASQNQMNYSDILDNNSMADSSDGSRDGSVLIGQRFVPPPRPSTDPYSAFGRDSA